MGADALPARRITNLYARVESARFVSGGWRYLMWHDFD
jgi:hypothetical protein